MTLNELTADSFAAIKSVTASLVLEKLQISTLHYIEFLAGSTSTDIKDWDLTEIFGYTLGNLPLITDKSVINKRFFEKRKSLTSNLSKSPIRSVSRLIDYEQTIHEIIQESKSGANKEIKRVIRRNENQIHEYITKISNLTKENYELQQSINLREQHRDDHMFVEFLQVAMSDFWNFHRVQGKKISFVTANDIVMVQRDASSIIRQVNLGRFKFKINMEDLEIRLTPYRGNVFHNGYYHPYVDRGGVICFGNASDAAYGLLQQFKFAEYMTLLQTLLTTYADTMPYVGLHSLEAALQEGGRVTDPVSALDAEEQASILCDERVKEYLQQKMAQWFNVTT